MKDLLNSINNDRLIKIGKNWDFFFLESNDSIPSPVNSYYFLGHDLSINLSLTLKWSLYGWFFFKSLDEALDDKDYYENIDFSDSINPEFESTKYGRILLVDSVDMKSFDVFKNEFENEYSKHFYNENSVVSFKLKLNPSEYIIIQDSLFPRLGEFKE